MRRRIAHTHIEARHANAVEARIEVAGLPPCDVEAVAFRAQECTSLLHIAAVEDGPLLQKRGGAKLHAYLRMI